MEKKTKAFYKYLAAWLRAGGEWDSPKLLEWLRDEQGMSDDEIAEFRDILAYGRMNLEASARKFIKKSA